MFSYTMIKGKQNMEVLRKADGDVSDKEQDRISELPDELIHHIFSYLETREVIPTSVLSKRWENLWTTLPCFRFIAHGGYSDYQIDKFVYNFLKKRNQDSLISEFTMYSPSCNRKILDYVISHHVEYLDFRAPSFALADYPCVTSAYIKTLRLGVTCFDPTEWTLPSLNSLDMEYVRFGKKMPIFGFQNLKDLTLAGYYEKKFFTINCPNLESLTLYLFRGGTFVVSAPKLSYFKIRTQAHVPGFSAENIFPSIKKVDFDIDVDIAEQSWKFCNHALEHSMQNFNNMLMAVGGTSLLKLSRKTVQVLRVILDSEEYQPCPLHNLDLLYLQGQGICKKPSRSIGRVVEYLLTNSPSAKIVTSK